MLVRWFAGLIGVAFVLAGVGGFVPLVSPPIGEQAPHLTMDLSYHLLLGLYPVNLIHNLVHLGLGAWGLAAARAGFIASRWYARGIAIILAVLTVMGSIPALDTTFGWMPLFGHDIWLHGLEAVVAAYLGWFHRPATHGSLA